VRLSPHEIEGLYAITAETVETALLVSMTQQAISGGARLIQYRNKTTDTRLHLEQARALVHLCRKVRIPLIINDYLDLAVEVSADGLHLGREDGLLSEARRRLGDEKILGASCYNRLDYAVEAQRQGADYVAFGAFFASSTKPNAIPASPALLRLAKCELNIPVVAIGGITSENAPQLINEGADALAVSKALYEASDICSAAQQFSSLFERNQIPVSHHMG
jgi:thiamine-phosphate pyrophosphorylase